MAGFSPADYEYVYVVADPVIAGLGFAAIRDFASYAKHRPDSIAPAARVYGEGFRKRPFLRDFLDEGSNGDEEANPRWTVFLAHVAGAPGRGSSTIGSRSPRGTPQPTSSVYFSNRCFPLHRSFPKPIDYRRARRLLDRARREGRAENLFSRTRPTSIGAAAALISVDAVASRCPAVRQCQDLSLHRTTHFPGLRRRAREMAISSAGGGVRAAIKVFLASDATHGCVGAERHTPPRSRYRGSTMGRSSRYVIMRFRRFPTSIGRRGQ